MRRNNFSSAADRRWQRRYERIQQRKEEERERRERQESEGFHAEMEEHERATRENSRGRGYRVQNMVVDDFYGFTFKNGGVIFFHDLEENPEPEQDLEAGDASVLDAFLGEFLSPGA